MPRDENLSLRSLRRSNPYYKPAAVLAGVLVNVDGWVDAKEFRTAFGEIMEGLQPGASGRWWQPFFHLQSDGVWNLFLGEEPSGFEDLSRGRPRGGESSVLKRADRARFAGGYLDWCRQDPEGLMREARALLDEARGVGAEVGVQQEPPAESKTAAYRRIALDAIDGSEGGVISISEIYDRVELEVSFDGEDLQSTILKSEPTGEPAWKRNVRNALQGMKGAGALVNSPKAHWRRPTPEPVTELAVEDFWRTCVERAAEVMAAEVVFSSTVREQRYRVSSANEEGVVVQRIDASKPQVVTRSNAARAVLYLNSAGGRVGRTCLFNTVAIETALVFLHPALRWSADGDWIEVLSAPSAVFEPTDDRELIEEQVSKLLESGRAIPRPEGNPSPKRGEPKPGKGGFIRDQNVIAYVLQAADDICEHCGELGPFFSHRTGGLYLEVHHVVHLADGGPDTVENCVALCPNCHRRAHHSSNAEREDMRERVYQAVGRLERVPGMSS